MDNEMIASELVGMARSLIGGTWSLPKDVGDIQKIIKIVKRMRNGEEPLPGRLDPNDALYDVFGDDQLFDRLDYLKRIFLSGCAEAVVDRLKEMAKEDRSNFQKPSDHNKIVLLVSKL